MTSVLLSSSAADPTRVPRELEIDPPPPENDALKAVPALFVPVRVTVDVKGETTRELDRESIDARDREEPTYADLLREVGLSPHEASVLVDGRPVPEDRPVAVDHVTVLRLIKGG